MTFNASSVLVDLAFASCFILIGQLLRSKISFFQRFFVPAGLLAGFLGLALGPNGYKIIPMSNQLGAYTTILSIVVFTSVGIKGFEVTSMKGLKDDAERLGSYLCFKEVCYALQYSLPILFSFYILSLFFADLPPGFGLIFPAGWAGGPGTAAAIGSTFAKYGWADATDLGLTSATLGILTGIFGGMLLIKWGTTVGATNYISDFGTLPPELRTGLIPKEKRESMGEETISGISLESLAWHLSFILLPAGMGYLLTGYVSKTCGLHMPTFSVAFLIALALSIPINRLGIRKYIDSNVTSAIGGCATDYLIVFGIASIKIQVIMKYAVPLIILQVCGAVLVFSFFLYFARRMNKKDWFERGMFVFGYLTGVYANSFILTRTVDPDYKSKTFEDTAMLGPLTSPVDIMVISVAPILLCTGKLWVFVGAMLAYFAFYLGLALFMKWWYPKLPISRKSVEISN